MKNTANADPSAFPAGGFISRLLFSRRRQMLDAFTVFRQGGDKDTILSINMMMPTPSFENADYLMEWGSLQDKLRITFHEITRPADSHLRAKHRQMQSDGPHLPFPDEAFDWVFCGEVIERIGSFERQYALLKELARVARKGVFVTAANRKHPLEFNTGIPFIHWLPDKWWRRILKWSGKNAWASESALNLLDARTLYTLAGLLPGKPKHDVGHKRVFGLKAHLFLMMEKNLIEQGPEEKSDNKTTF